MFMWSVDVLMLTLRRQQVQQRFRRGHDRLVQGIQLQPALSPATVVGMSKGQTIPVQRSAISGAHAVRQRDKVCSTHQVLFCGTA